MDTAGSAIRCASPINMVLHTGEPSENSTQQQAYHKCLTQHGKQRHRVTTPNGDIAPREYPRLRKWIQPLPVSDAGGLVFLFVTALPGQPAVSDVARSQWARLKLRLPVRRRAFQQLAVNIAEAGDIKIGSRLRRCADEG
jgi:hypothetical protein